MPSGKDFFSLSIRGAHLVEASIAFDPGRWAMPIATAGWLSSRLRSAYLLEPSSTRPTSRIRVICPSGRGADDDVGELLLGRQPALRVDRELEGRLARRRRRAEHAGGDLDVLLADRRTTSVAVSCARGETVGIEPHPHAVFAGAEDLHAADAADAGELVLHPQVGVVREVEHVVALVRRDEVDDHHEIGRGLLGGHADALHFRGQPRQRLRDAVLHLDLRVVEVAAQREGDRQRHQRRRRSTARTCRACPRRR